MSCNSDVGRCEIVKIGRIVSTDPIALGGCLPLAGFSGLSPEYQKPILGPSCSIAKGYVYTIMAEWDPFWIVRAGPSRTKLAKSYAKCQHVNEKTRFLTPMFP
jgi:hypothetical protein